MPKRLRKTNKRDTLKVAKVKITADVCRVSARHVYRVIQGDRKNDEVIRAYLFLDQGFNKLIQAVKKIVKFN